MNDEVDRFVFSSGTSYFSANSSMSAVGERSLVMMITGGFLENRSSREARTKFGLLFSKKEYSVMPISWILVGSKCS